MRAAVYQTRRLYRALNFTRNLRDVTVNLSKSVSASRRNQHAPPSPRLRRAGYLYKFLGIKSDRVTSGIYHQSDGSNAVRQVKGETGNDGRPELLDLWQLASASFTCT